MICPHCGQATDQFTAWCLWCKRPLEKTLQEVVRVEAERYRDDLEDLA